MGLNGGFNRAPRAAEPEGSGEDVVVGEIRDVAAQLEARLAALPTEPTPTPEDGDGFEAQTEQLGERPDDFGSTVRRMRDENVS